MAERDYLPIFNAPLSERDALDKSPLALSFVGDAVQHLLVRARLVSNSSAKAGLLHVKATGEVKAEIQAAMFDIIEPELDEIERDVFRRARNSKAASAAKHASLQDYKKASGFEALIGFLYLTGRHERLSELYGKAFNAIAESDKHI